MLKRNVEGLRQQAEYRHQATLQRAEAGISQLLREKQTVNFRTVSQVSRVSVAWLYRQPKIRARIEQLRQLTNQPKMQDVASASTTAISEASKNAMLISLRQRLKQVEAENQELKRQLEVAYGLVYKQGQLNL